MENTDRDTPSTPALLAAVHVWDDPVITWGDNSSTWDGTAILYTITVYPTIVSYAYAVITWTPIPGQTYTVARDGVTVATGLTIPIYRDDSLSQNVTYTYTVTSGIDDSGTVTITTLSAAPLGFGMHISYQGEWLQFWPEGADIQVSKGGAWVRLDTAPGDVIPPPIPTDLHAAQGNTLANLSWTPSSDPGIATYLVHQATSGPTGPWTLIAAVAHPDAALTVTGLTNDTTYYFTVSAVDSVGNESPLAPAVSVTPATTVLCAYPGAVDALVHWHVTADPCPRTEWLTPVGSEIIVYAGGAPLYNKLVASIHGCVPFDALGDAIVLPNHGTMGGNAAIPIALKYDPVGASVWSGPVGPCLYATSSSTGTTNSGIIGTLTASPTPDSVGKPLWTSFLHSPSHAVDEIDYYGGNEALLITDPTVYFGAFEWGFMFGFNAWEVGVAGVVADPLDRVTDYLVHDYDLVPTESTYYLQPTATAVGNASFSAVAGSRSYSLLVPPKATLTETAPPAAATGTGVAGLFIWVANADTTDPVNIQTIYANAYTTYAGSPHLTPSWATAQAWWEATYPYQYYWDIYAWPAA